MKLAAFLSLAHQTKLFDGIQKFRLQSHYQSHNSCYWRNSDALIGRSQITVESWGETDIPQTQRKAYIYCRSYLIMQWDKAVYLSVSKEVSL